MGGQSHEPTGIPAPKGRLCGALAGGVVWRQRTTTSAAGLGLGQGPHVAATAPRRGSGTFWASRRAPRIPAQARFSVAGNGSREAGARAAVAMWQEATADPAARASWRVAIPGHEATRPPRGCRRGRGNAAEARFDLLCPGRIRVCRLTMPSETSDVIDHAPDVPTQSRFRTSLISGAAASLQSDGRRGTRGRACERRKRPGLLRRGERHPGAKAERRRGGQEEAARWPFSLKSA